MTVCVVGLVADGLLEEKDHNEAAAGRIRAGNIIDHAKRKL